MRDIILRRMATGDVMVSIPHTAVWHSTDGMNWGYEGSGPADLALNIVELALRELKHNGEREKLYKGSAFVLAIRLHQTYKRQVIARIRNDDYVIKGSSVIAWVVNECLDRNICLKCGNELRYADLSVSKPQCPDCKFYLPDRM